MCSQTEGLDIEEDPKAKKKAKVAEIARLKGLGLEGVMEEARLPKDVQFEPFDPESQKSAMIIKLNSINLMNSSNLWAPRNAKALKCIIAAGEGIHHIKEKAGHH